MVRNVIEYLEYTADRYPDKTALIDETGEISFCELRKEALKIAGKISDVCGSCINQPIAVCIKKGIKCIVAFGNSIQWEFYSPIDMNSPADRIARIISVLKPEVVIFDEETGSNTINNCKSFSIQEAKNETAKVDAYKKVLDIDPLYVLFTSGSTGLPKGVVISHKGVIDYIEWLHNTFQFDETTIFGNQAPFYFDNSILDIYSMLKNGSTMVIIPEKMFSFPRQLMDYIEEKKINTLFWVPSALISVANSGVLEHSRLDDLRKVLFCGEVMPNKQLNIWRKTYPDIMYANLYGPTEVTDVCTYYVVNREFKDEEPLPIGNSCKNMEIIVIGEDGKLVNDSGEIGELCVRGTGLSMGYYGDYEKTDAVYVQNPFHSRYRDSIYRTGDLVKYNELGELIYICRKDFQIKHQGHRIELGEIETAAGAIDGIQQSCAIYDDTHKRIILVCTLLKDMKEKNIYKQLQDKLPKYMLPSLIKLRDKMPLNANGKIDRKQLKKEFTNDGID